ncbi:MAG: hypothetical protein ACR2JV_07755 [Gaiellales bacterium]
MAAQQRPFRGRFLAAEAALVACGLALLGAFAWQVAHLERWQPRSGTTTTAVDAFPEYHRDVRAARRLLVPLFPGDATARAYGLRITPNSFDLRDPPVPTSMFVVPLPGQNPYSPMTVEFFAAGFIIGRAQSFQLAHIKQGRLTLIAWAFTSHEGALRAFRAYRDTTGLPGRPNAYAPYAGLKGAAAHGLEELFWVRGRLLLQSSYAAPQDDLTAIQRAHRRLTAYFDAHVRAVTADPAPTPVLPDLSPLGRLREIAVPEVELPGGLATRPGASGLQVGAMRGWQAAPALDVAFSRLGLLGVNRQVIGVAGMSLGHYELAADRFPTARAAQRALDLLARQPRTRVAQLAGLGRTLRVDGPGGGNFSDLWWRHGALLLRASSYASRLAPLPSDQRLRLARQLDRRATLALALVPR